jgi:hypothetical protein
MSDTNKGNGELKGSTLKVVRGKKVPLGTVGLCIWHGFGKKEAWGKRVGIKDSEGTVHWTAEKNCECVAKGAQSAQRELFGASKRDDSGLSVPSLIVWFERFNDQAMSLVAFNGCGEKLVHDHVFDNDCDALRLVLKVKDSGKTWDELSQSPHWTLNRQSAIRAA